ncbi:retrovirus-related pol polyprotein from transposon TNT 1-94 [Tanacetum coccineum]
MHKELHQFKMLNVWELVERPAGKNIIRVKWLWKNKTDAEITMIRNKSRLVAKWYHHEEGINFEESFALVARLKRIQGLDTAYWGFLGVGTTLDIFQNIHILFLKYDVLSIFGYGVLSFNPLWSLVSAGTNTPYLRDGYDVLVFRIIIFKISSFKLQNARLLLIFTKYSIITAILK